MRRRKKYGLFFSCFISLISVIYLMSCVSTPIKEKSILQSIIFRCDAETFGKNVVILKKLNVVVDNQEKVNFLLSYENKIKTHVNGDIIEINADMNDLCYSDYIQNRYGGELFRKMKSDGHFIPEYLYYLLQFMPISFDFHNDDDFNRTFEVKYDEKISVDLWNKAIQFLDPNSYKEIDSMELQKLKDIIIYNTKEDWNKIIGLLNGKLIVLENGVYIGKNEESMQYFPYINMYIPCWNILSIKKTNMEGLFLVNYKIASGVFNGISYAMNTELYTRKNLDYFKCTSIYSMTYMSENNEKIEVKYSTEILR